MKTNINKEDPLSNHLINENNFDILNDSKFKLKDEKINSLKEGKTIIQNEINEIKLNNSKLKIKIEHLEHKIGILRKSQKQIRIHQFNYYKDILKNGRDIRYKYK